MGGNLYLVCSNCGTALFHVGKIVAVGDGRRKFQSSLEIPDLISLLQAEWLKGRRLVDEQGEARLIWDFIEFLDRLEKRVLEDWEFERVPWKPEEWE